MSVKLKGRDDFIIDSYLFCALWQKAKTRKCWKSTEGFLNQKNTHH